MSSHSSHRNGFHSRSYQSLASISSPDSGQLYGSSREMAPPPPVDYSAVPAPQPIEIDLSNSARTLPSPSMSGSNSWDILQPQPHGLGDGPYGPSNMTRMQQLPLEGQVRGDPIYNWYAGNDGPWTPSGIVAPSEEKLHSRQISNRNPMSYGNHYRQPNPSEAGSVQYGVAPSDSGYGTRHSVGNTSIFSGDVAERDQDCRSLASHVENYQPFQGFNEIGHQRDSRTSTANENWDHSAPNSTGSESPGLTCPTCKKAVKTQSELKKHDLRHRKPFKCHVQGCTRVDGFSTTNDLDRHTRSKHPSALSESIPTKKFRCHVPGCKSKDKTWPRLDNFRSHLKRVHSHHLITDEDFEDMIRRAEFWEKPTFEVDQDSLFPQRPFQDSPRAGISSHENVSNFRRPELDWKTRLYPDVLSSPEAPMASMAPMAPKLPQLDKFETKPVPPEERSAVPQACHPDTVQPLQVFQPPTGVPENKFTLKSVLAPAGTDPAVEITNHPNPNPAAQPEPQGKATRQTDVLAADAVVAEVIRTALSGAGSPDLANDRVITQDMKRNSLPNGKTTTGSSWSSGPNPAIASRGRTTSHINLVDSPSPDREIDEAHVRKATEQVLKNLQDRGFTIRRDRSPSPRIQNPGSVASNKSENQVTCQKCRKFRGRPCELKKHMKRHERPYGCTFLTCNKTFGSKNDWKRHENSQHFQLETWRCDEERPEGGACAKVCYRKQTFQEHLSKEHQISDTASVNDKVEACRIGRNCQARFWCGFCTKLVELKKKGLEAWTERFDHIDDHFMGRHNWPKQGIQDWIPVDSDKPKGDSPSDLPAGKEGHDSGPDPSGSGSPSGTSPDASGAPGGSSADAMILGTDRPGSPKRKHSSGDENSRPQKHPKTAANVETTIFCCQCRVAHNPDFNQSCTNCNNSHEFCQYCIRERRRI